MTPRHGKAASSMRAKTICSRTKRSSKRRAAPAPRRGTSGSASAAEATPQEAPGRPSGGGLLTAPRRGAGRTPPGPARGSRRGSTASRARTWPQRGTRHSSSSHCSLLSCHCARPCGPLQHLHLDLPGAPATHSRSREQTPHTAGLGWKLPSPPRQTGSACHTQQQPGADATHGRLGGPLPPPPPGHRRQGQPSSLDGPPNKPPQPPQPPALGGPRIATRGRPRQGTRQLVSASPRSGGGTLRRSLRRRALLMVASPRSGLRGGRSSSRASRSSSPIPLPIPRASRSSIASSTGVLAAASPASLATRSHCHLRLGAALAPAPVHTDIAAAALHRHQCTAASTTGSTSAAPSSLRLLTLPEQPEAALPSPGPLRRYEGVPRLVPVELQVQAPPRILTGCPRSLGSSLARPHPLLLRPR